MGVQVSRTCALSIDQAVVEQVVSTGDDWKGVRRTLSEVLHGEKEDPRKVRRWSPFSLVILSWFGVPCANPCQYVDKHGSHVWRHFGGGSFEFVF